MAQAVTCCQKKFMLKQKSSNLYMMCSNSVGKFLTDYLSTWHGIGMRSKTLYINGPFETCQQGIVLKQGRTHCSSSYLPGKNVFILKQKS